MQIDLRNLNMEYEMLEEAKKTRNSFTAEQVAQIRADRAVPAEEDPTRPANSHAMLATKYGTTAGVISQIVRNRTYKDAAYTPTFDGR